MDYNDFQIMDDSAYEMIKHSYENIFQTPTFERGNHIETICSELKKASNSTFTLKENLNFQIRKQIEKTNQILLKNFDNLTNLFNINIKQQQQIKGFNIFSFLNQLIKIFSLLQTWQTNETKEYFKSVAKNSLNEILSSTQVIIKELENSNIIFFKHM